MRRILTREKIRTGLLEAVYEQNLVILGLRAASRRPPPAPTRRGLLLVIVLGAVLFAQAVPLPGIPWRATAPPRELAAEWAPAATEPALALSRLGAPALGLTGESDAAEYGSLTRGDQLKIRKVFGLGVKTIMIDPGHGGEASGAIGRGGTVEKAINLDIARKLKAALARHTGYRILMTREDDRDVSLKSRVEMANDSKADLFISIHVNAAAPLPIDMVETYYFGPSRDKQVLELAAEVNEGSDYSYSEYNEVIKKIANQLKYQESVRLARSIQDTLYQQMKRRKPDVRDYGVRRAPFVVLLGVEMPAVLVEVACLSNVEEEDRLRDPGYRETIAGYLEAGIIKYLGATTKRSGVS